MSRSCGRVRSGATMSGSMGHQKRIDGGQVLFGEPARLALERQFAGQIIVTRLVVGALRGVEVVLGAEQIEFISGTKLHVAAARLDRVTAGLDGTTCGRDSLDPTYYTAVGAAGLAFCVALCGVV